MIATVPVLFVEFRVLVVAHTEHRRVPTYLECEYRGYGNAAAEGTTWVVTDRMQRTAAPVGAAPTPIGQRRGLQDAHAPHPGQVGGRCRDLRAPSAPTDAERERCPVPVTVPASGGRKVRSTSEIG